MQLDAGQIRALKTINVLFLDNMKHFAFLTLLNVSKYYSTIPVRFCFYFICLCQFEFIFFRFMYTYDAYSEVFSVFIIFVKQIN